MKVTLIKSLIGSKKDQIATAHALGLYNDIKGDSDEEYRHCRIDRQLLFVQKPHLLLKIAS